MPPPPPSAGPPSLDALASLVEHGHEVAPALLLSTVRQAAAALGALDVEILLVDFQQEHLTHLEADERPEVPRRVRVDGSTAGRAFRLGQPLRQPTGDGRVRVNAPLLDGIDRLGILQLTLPGDGTDALAEVRRFAELVTQFVSTKGRVTDEMYWARAAEPMSLAAQIQWQALPPSTAHCPTATIAGQVEPAYHVGGDAFDYAFNRDRAHLAIFDAMGHGLSASLTTALAIGAYRNSRRGAQGLVDTLQSVDQALSAEFGGDRFVTALLAEADLATGRLTLLNAGHLQPLLLRGHHLLPVPEVPPGLPLGLGGLALQADERLVELTLEAGDRIVLVTDGILDATDEEGVPFGEQRLADLTERAALDQLPLAELVRSIARGVYDYQHGKLRDDASLVIFEYHGVPGVFPQPATAPAGHA